MLEPVVDFEGEVDRMLDLDFDRVLKLDSHVRYRDLDVAGHGEVQARVPVTHVTNLANRGLRTVRPGPHDTNAAAIRLGLDQRAATPDGDRVASTTSE